MYERLLGRKLDKSAFRKRVAEAGFLVPVEGEMRRASNRPAQVFRLKDAQSLVFSTGRYQSKIRALQLHFRRSSEAAMSVSNRGVFFLRIWSSSLPN